MSTTYAVGDATIIVEADGYITDTTDWNAVVEASHYSTTSVHCRTTYDGAGTYGLEYYYTRGE